MESPAVRDRILDTAQTLFYNEGVRAVGVDLIVARSGVAKTSLYRHFPTKDDLTAAFLRREDEEFWQQWDSVSARHDGDPQAELAAHAAWITKRVTRPGYRGCPQINVAAEFPAADHPAHAVAVAHKTELRHRLRRITDALGVAHPAALADQLALVIDGAFVSGQVLGKSGPAHSLPGTVKALVAAHA